MIVNELIINVMYKTYKLDPLSIIGSLPRFFINKPVRTPNSTPKINQKKRYIDLGDLEIYIIGSFLITTNSR